MDQKPDEKAFHMAAYQQSMAALDVLRKQQDAGQPLEWAAIWRHANDAADHALDLSRLWAEEAERLHQIADGAVP